MLKRFLLLSVILFIFNITAPLSAQTEGNWTLVLLNHRTSAVLHITPDGANEYTLNPYFFGFAYQSAITPDGKSLIFCDVIDDHAVVASLNYQMGIYRLDFATGAVSEPIILQDFNYECNISSLSFNADGSQVAVGFSVDYVDMPITWRVVLIDLVEQKIIHEINSSQIDVPLDYNPTPVVVFHNEEKMIIQLQRWGAERSSRYPALEWTLADNTVTLAPGWDHGFLARSPKTGEYILLDVDEDYPIGGPNGMGYTFNVALLRDAEGNDTLFFHEPNWAIQSVEFIDAETVVFYIENDDTEGVSARRVAVNLDGTMSDLPLRDREEDYIVLPSQSFIDLNDRIVTYPDNSPIWQAPEEELYDWDLVGAVEN